MNTIKHTEYKYNGRRVILDTCELTPGKYETMLLYPNGHEIDCRTARTEADAIADFDELLSLPGRHQAHSTQAAYRQVRQAPRRSAQGVRDRQSRSRTS